MKANNKYWIALSALQSKGIEKINRYLIEIYIDRKSSLPEHIESLLKSSDSSPENSIDSMIIDELKRSASLEHEISDLGVEAIPVVSAQYPKILKDKLKTKHSPPVLFVKGDASMLKDPATAIVGSRNASQISLDFTSALAGKLASLGRVIVSGYAKGVDTKALESAVEAGGRSIIVLPQGILTFKTGLKKLDKLIRNGQVLVLSYFHPKSPWSVGLAMARNKVIYGLSEEIYIAESGSSGGTWTGAKEGLKRNDMLYVRIPEPGERNANMELINKGATGYSLDVPYLTSKTESTAVVSDLTSCNPKINKP